MDPLSMVLRMDNTDAPWTDPLWSLYGSSAVAVRAWSGVVERSGRERGGVDDQRNHSLNLNIYVLRFHVRTADHVWIMQP